MSVKALENFVVRIMAKQNQTITTEDLLNVSNDIDQLRTCSKQSLGHAPITSISNNTIENSSEIIAQNNCEEEKKCLTTDKETVDADAVVPDADAVLPDADSGGPDADSVVPDAFLVVPDIHAAKNASLTCSNDELTQSHNSVENSPEIIVQNNCEEEKKCLTTDKETVDAVLADADAVLPDADSGVPDADAVVPDADAVLPDAFLVVPDIHAAEDASLTCSNNESTLSHNSVENSPEIIAQNNCEEENTCLTTDKETVDADAVLADADSVVPDADSVVPDANAVVPDADEVVPDADSVVPDVHAAENASLTCSNNELTLSHNSVENSPEIIAQNNCEEENTCLTTDKETVDADAVLADADAVLPDADSVVPDVHTADASLTCSNDELTLSHNTEKLIPTPKIITTNKREIKVEISSDDSVSQKEIDVKPVPEAIPEQDVAVAEPDDDLSNGNNPETKTSKRLSKGGGPFTLCCNSGKERRGRKGSHGKGRKNSKES